MRLNKFVYGAILALFVTSHLVAEEGSAVNAPQSEMGAVSTPKPASSLSAEVSVGTGIENFDPVGVAESFPASTSQLIGWSRVSGAQEPTTVSHVWLYAGKEAARVDLNVKTSRFRTWSRVTLAGRAGTWTLQVVDSSGNTVASKTFEVTP